jgi:nucleotide-binding universal stress UspA family protein
VRYATLLVHMIIGRPNGAVLKAAGELANLLGARTVGIAACQPAQFISRGEYSDGAVVGMLHDEFDKETKATEAEYRAAFESAQSPLEWRSSDASLQLPDYLAREARCADLIITSAAPANRFDSSRHVNIGDLIMRAGRPVLVVPHAGMSLPFQWVVVAWKDTREARRAIRDAMPLLKAAKNVTIVEIASDLDEPKALRRVKDVATWLESHGVKAVPLVSPSKGDDASCLDAIFESQAADLVVAGAFGHSRLREWAFGGVTDSLLRTGRCALLSH